MRDLLQDGLECLRDLGPCAAVFLGLTACGSSAPPAAAIAAQVSFPDSDLVRMPNLSLIEAGNAVTLAGYQAPAAGSANGQIRWGRASFAGALTVATGFELSPPVLGPAFAVVESASPADQLVTLAMVASATVAGGYTLEAIVQDLSAPAPGSPVVLAALPAGTVQANLRMTAGAAKTGTLGFVAWGVTGSSAVQYLVLGPGATVVAQGTAFDQWAGGPAWDCLAPTNGPSGLGMSVVAPDLTLLGSTDWVTSELDGSGAPTGEMEYSFPQAVSGCSITGSPTAVGGYDIAFADPPGIGGVFYYPPPSGATSGSDWPFPLLMSANSFHDLRDLPEVAFAAPAGSDMLIGLARASGPYLVRFTDEGVPHGSALPLPSSSGNTGPVASWVGPDYIYVTYTDQVSLTNVVRRWVTVDPLPQLP
ncbi:MAG: hypothetical protein ABSB49_18825 [Polyangia bacterium]